MTQPGPDGKPRLVAYYSKKLIDAELNYEIHDKELLAIIRALQHWRVYLEGAKYLVRIITDYKNLTYFTTTKVLMRRQARWSEIFGNYYFIIEHYKGKENERADALSRRPDHEEGIKTPELALLRTNRKGDLEYNPQITTLAATAEVTTDLELQDKLVKETLKDEWTETGLVFWHGLIYVPKTLRNKIIQLHHDTLTSGHPGQANTLERVSRNYYWPRIIKDIKKYIEECDMCQKNKIKRHKPYRLLQEIEAPEYPWQWITMDYIVKLPESDNCNTILVVMDRLTKYAHFIPTVEEINAEGLAQILMEEVFKHHGIPEIIVSDRGATFLLKLWKSMMNLMGGQQRLSTAYHPQTNGQTERTNQTLEQYLRHYVNHD
ncbi:retrovirus polyprotein, putative [Talaromyces marneffei ATCC 18224]|uniref:Retrovirus polyprotein, putative n=1 Tax=Talaromyces marneffei (strain ATCC 18224 / CBS 334.59 / QM 7333) TaxID=441960 RepID=B6Q790_TALMQ|nr:retrovirus polyprotein, putative [Talaromyces marneffei ATCC 18224]